MPDGTVTPAQHCRILIYVDNASPLQVRLEARRSGSCRSSSPMIRDVSNKAVNEYLVNILGQASW